jgi:hypothetical protein
MLIFLVCSNNGNLSGEHVERIRVLKVGEIFSPSRPPFALIPPYSTPIYNPLKLTRLNRLFSRLTLLFFRLTGSPDSFCRLVQFA